MAKYYVDCQSCGSEMTIQLYGDMKKREWIIENGTHICDKCKRVERKEKSNLSAEKNIDFGLPRLSGSEKQIAWAEDLRYKVYSDNIRGLDNEFKQLSVQAMSQAGLTREDVMPIQKKLHNLVGVAFDNVMENDKAKWWIDNRNNYASALTEEWMKLVLREVGK